MDTTTPTSTRRLVAAGKAVPTPGGHRAVLLEWNRAGIGNPERVHEFEPDEEPDTDCHCGHPECGAC